MSTGLLEIIQGADVDALEHVYKFLSKAEGPTPNGDRRKRARTSKVSRSPTAGASSSGGHANPGREVITIEDDE